MSKQLAKKPKITDLTAKAGHMIKPLDMIEMRGLGGWTLTHFRTWTTLLHNAWGAELDDPNADFTITMKAVLEGHDHRDRLREALSVMKRTTVFAYIDGREWEFQMLGSTSLDKWDDRDRDDGKLIYDYPKKFVQALRKTDLYAQLELKVMNAFTSKYSIALYELVSKRIGLKYKAEEEITLDDLRDWLRVPAGKLALWGDFERRALRLALKEVNELSPYTVTITPIKRYNRVDAVTMTWAKKVPMSDDEQGAVKEVNRPKVGRKARLAGTVETITPEGEEYILTTKLAAIIKKALPKEKPQAVWDEWILPELRVRGIKNIEQGVLYLSQKYGNRA